MEKSERISPDTAPIERPACRLQTGEQALLIPHPQPSLLVPNKHTPLSQAFQGAVGNRPTGQRFTIFPRNQGSVLLAGNSNVHIRPLLSVMNQGGIQFQQVRFQSQPSLFSQVPVQSLNAGSSFTQFQLKPGSASAQNNFLFQPEIKLELSANSTEPTGLFQNANNDQNITLQNQNKDGQQNRLPEHLQAASTSFSMSDECEQSSLLTSVDTSQDFPGTSQNFPGTSQDFPGTSQDLPGTSQNLPGTSQDFPGTSQDFPGTSQDLPGTSQDFPGTSLDLSGASQDEDSEAVTVQDAEVDESKTESSDAAVVIDEKDILILWNLIGEWKEFKTNGDIARYLLSLYFNPRRESNPQSTEKCVHCGDRLSFCCASCILASKPTPTTNPPSHTATDVSQFSDTDFQDGDDFDEDHNQIEAPTKKGKRVESCVKKVPQEIENKRTRNLISITTDWEKRFNINKTAVVELKKLDTDSALINRNKSNVRCFQSSDGTTRYKKSHSTAASAPLNKNEQSPFSKIAQQENTASTHLVRARKQISKSKRTGARKKIRLHKNKPDDNKRENRDLCQKADNKVASSLNYDSDTDVAEPMQCEDDSRDSFSQKPEIPSKAPNTKTVSEISSKTPHTKPVSQDSSIVADDSTSSVQHPTFSTEEPVAQSSASLDPNTDDKASSSCPPSSSDLTSPPGSSQTSKRATRSSGPVPVVEEEAKEKYPICDGIHFKNGRITTSYIFYSEYVCSKCNKTFAKKQEINRHMKTPRCDLDDNIFKQTRRPNSVNKPKPAESDEDWSPSHDDRPKLDNRHQGSDDESDTDLPKLPVKKRYRSQREYTLADFMTGKIQIPIDINRKKKQYYYSHYTCSKCCRVFTKSREYRGHKCDPKFALTPAEGPDPESKEILKKILERRMFCCPHCDRIFFNKEQRKMHIHSHNYSVDENGIITCHFCGEPFMKLVYLLQHIKIAKQEMKTCQECGYEFVSRCQIHPHMKDHEKKKPPEPCTICDQSFEGWRKVDITKHLNSHKERRVMSLCIICGKNVPTVNYKSHLLHHSEEKPFQCSQCDRAFKTKACLVKHEVFHKEKQFQCEECGASFFFSLQLKRHINWVHLNKGFNCKHCGKKLSSKRHLKGHVRRIHEDKRNFNCTYCGRKFLTKHDLVNHERIHTGEKPFECQVCQARFSRKVYLSVHMRIHTGEKPYQCDDCGEKFAMRTSYTSHRKSRHPDTWLSCQHCSKVFPDKVDLDNHCNIFHDTGSTDTGLLNDADSTPVTHSHTFTDTGTAHVSHSHTLTDTGTAHVSHSHPFTESDATRVSTMDTGNERQEDGMDMNEGAANTNFELLFPSLT